MEKVIMRRRRHIAKAITWRIIGSLDTFLIATILLYYFNHASYSDSSKYAAWIAGIELITKTILYYFHERAWFASKWGIENRARHIFKTITWRILGSLDTFLIATILLYYFNHASYSDSSKYAAWITGIELITKTILYYLHERVWFASNWGIIKPPKD
jgi:uncharacterized membrane protein